MTHRLSQSAPPESIPELFDLVGRESIRSHYNATSRKGTRYHEDDPVVSIQVRMSQRLLREFFADPGPDSTRPTEVDGVPLVFVEAPPRGPWDLTMMCQYVNKRTGEIARSRGFTAHVPHLVNT